LSSVVFDSWGGKCWRIQRCGGREGLVDAGFGGRKKDTPLPFFSSHFTTFLWRRKSRPTILGDQGRKLGKGNEKKVVQLTTMLFCVACFSAILTTCHAMCFAFLHSFLHDSEHFAVSIFVFLFCLFVDSRSDQTRSDQMMVGMMGIGGYE